MNSILMEVAAWGLGVAALFFLLRIPLLGITTFRHDNILWAYPIYQFFADHAANGRIPYWNPYSHSGEPFYLPIAHCLDLQPLSFLLTWLGSRWTSDALLLFNWGRVLQSLFMVFGVYLTLRRFCRSWMARVALIPVLLFSSAMLGSFQQDARYEQFLFVPYIAYFFLSIVRFGRDRWPTWLLLSAFIGLNYLSYFIVGMWLFLGFMILGLALFRRDLLAAVVRRPGFASKLGVALAVQLVMTAPIWAIWRSSRDLVFPARMVDDSNERKVLGGPRQDEGASYPANRLLDYATAARTGSFSHPMDFAAMVWPTRNQFPSAKWADWGSGASEAFIYLGLWPWALGLLGLCLGSDGLKRVWVFLTAVFFLLMLGPPGGLHRILFGVFPLFRLQRHMHVYVCFFEFCFLYFYVLGLNCALEGLDAYVQRVYGPNKEAASLEFALQRLGHRAMARLETPAAALKAIADSPSRAHAFLALTFVLIGMTFVFRGLTPTHDAIGWYGVFHYFYTSIAQGIFPFWNPYTQAGTPFYPTLQVVGTWEPSNYLFILLQKITGCSTLTTYLFHYLFYYFLFVAGTYNSLRVIVKRNDISLLFSLVLLLGTFPVFMRQNGALDQFYMVPFVTYFLMRFLKETEPDQKGLYLFVTASLCAMSCLVYIPAGLIFYVLFFVLTALILGILRQGKVGQWAASRRGLLWLGASLATAALIVAPVLALNHDFKVNNEMFPYARVQLSSLHYLPKMFASDQDPGIFNKKLASPVSITLGNLVGLLAEPWPAMIGASPRISEIVLYIGILPLLCVFVFARRAREIGNKYAQLALVIAGVTLLVMSNLGTWVSGPPSVFQRLLISFIPTMNKIEVFENFGSIFLFCLIIVSASGFRRALDDGGKAIWFLALLIWALKYPWILLASARIPKNVAFGIYLCSLVLLGGWLLDHRKGISAIPVKNLQVISIVLLFLDLFYFNAVHIQDGTVVGKEFHAALRQEDNARAQGEEFFANYRESLAEGPCVYTFFGREILSAKRVALPALIRRFTDGCVMVDNVFSTQAYYDHLVNVGLDKQLATSGVIYPILNFYPARDAVMVRDSHEAVQRINQLDARAVGKQIFIEKGGSASAPAALDYSRVLDPGNYRYFDEEELGAFARAKAFRFPGDRRFRLEVAHSDQNSLSAMVDAPEDGYLYFSDGYSKHWKAFLDDREVKIEKTNVNFKSIRVPRGEHRVAFVYDPVYIRYAVYASGVGSLMALLLVALYAAARLYSPVAIVPDYQQIEC